MVRYLRIGLVGAIVAAAMFGAVARAVDTPLPTEFTSGGVRWGDSTGDDGFYNGGNVCDGNGFVMGDAELLATGQTDAFDDAGEVHVADGVHYTVPGGTNGPVDLTGSTLTAPVAPTGPLNVGVQWQGAGAGTIRELVSLTNPSGAAVTQQVTIENNLGSDGSTFLQASSTGDTTTYPTTARWFATSDSNGTPGDPPVVSVATGPGTVQSPATIVDCETGDGSALRPAEQAKGDAAAVTAESTTTTTTGGDPAATADPSTDAPAASAADDTVSAAGTDIDTDTFTYQYSVSIPPGETRYLMMFWTLTSTNAEVIAAGPTWNTNPAAGSDLLAGISGVQLQQIVNWAFPIAPRFTG